METGVTELELQQQLERFTTQFTDRITQAAETLERNASPEVRDDVIRKQLLYVSSATEIATGAYPIVNLLDMIVFIRLCRSVLQRHWIPKFYGADGDDLEEAFARSDEELSQFAAGVISGEQRAQLTSLVDAWLLDNMDQVRVEGVRLADFSAVAGAAAADRAARARGLLASVKTATRAVDQALLLSERGLFLVHRLPFLWRMQARLGAREMMSDAFAQLTDGPQAALTRFTRQARRIAGRVTLAVGVSVAATLLFKLIASRRRDR